MRWADDGCPLDSPAAAADWLEANGKAKHTRAWRALTNPKAPRPPPPSGELDPSVDGMLARVRTSEVESFSEWRNALDPYEKNKCLMLHAQAVKNRVACEAQIMDLAVKSGQLLTPQAAQDVILAALTPLARWLDELADVVNARCPLSLDQRQAITDACEEAKATIRASLPSERP